MKNIMILIDTVDYLSGGTERHIVELCQKIDRKRYNLIVACLSDKDGLLADIAKYSVRIQSFKVHRIYSLFGVLKGLKFIGFAKKERVDVLITYHFSSDIWGTIFGRLAGVKVIVSSRRDLGFWKLKHYNLAYRIINRWVDKVVTVSGGVKDEIIKREFISPEKVEVIYNGVDLDYFTKTIGPTFEAKTLGFNKKDFIVGVISFLRPEKGIDYFLRAAAIVSKELPNTQFVVVGDGPEKEKLINITKQLNIENNVSFIGWQTDVPKILNTFDILVCPSFTEGFSNTVIEAMACHKPVVATAVGGNKEAISNEETGILVKPKDAQSLSKAILSILKDEDKRIKMGIAAYDRVKKEFEIKDSISKLQKIIDDVFYAKNPMYIPTFPTLSFSQLIKNVARRPSYHDQRIIYTYCGRPAIYNGIKSLNLNSNSNILMPSYQCGVETDMVLLAGANVKFYNLNEDMTIDIEDIKKQIDNNTKGIYVIHYFGFIQPMAEVRAICNERNLFLIEDCAHLLLDLRDTQKICLGDIQIFSFIKTMPVPDGGALVIKKNDIAYLQRNAKINKSLVFSRAMLSLAENIKFEYRTFSLFFETLLIKPLRYTFRLMKNISRSKSTRLLNNHDNEFYKEISGHSISNLSLNIIESADYEKDSKKRRENFQFLLQNIRRTDNITILYDNLPDDVTPLFFPILTKNRDMLKYNLEKKGVQAFIFGKNLHPHVSCGSHIFSKKLSDYNLCLPIHQNLDRKHMEYIAHVYNSEVEQLKDKEEVILHLISSNGLFGAEKVMLNLAARMNGGAVRHYVAAVRNIHNPHDEVIRAAEKENIPVFTVESRGRFDLKAVKTLAGFIKKNNIKILYTHNYKANVLGLLAAKRTGVPIMAVLHGYIGRGIKLRIYEALDRWILRFFDKVILVDSSMRELFRNRPVNLTVINNGIGAPLDFARGGQEHPSAWFDFAHHRSLGAGRSTRAQVEIKENGLVIGTVGRLSREKGHRYLLEAFSRLAREYSNIRLLIVGDGELKEELEDVALTLGIRDEVDFAGFQEEVSRYYELMDIYVSPSLTEHFPLSILEAMSFKKAIVATNVGGTPDLIKARHTGMLIGPASSGEIYTALLILIEDEALRTRLGNNAAQFVREHYSLEKMVDSYNRVQEEVLALGVGR